MGRILQRLKTAFKKSSLRSWLIWRLDAVTAEEYDAMERALGPQAAPFVALKGERRIETISASSIFAQDPGEQLSDYGIAQAKQQIAREIGAAMRKRGFISYQTKDFKEDGPTGWNKVVISGTAEVLLPSGTDKAPGGL